MIKMIIRVTVTLIGLHIFTHIDGMSAVNILYELTEHIVKLSVYT